MRVDARIRILVIVNARFGYDGISNVAESYYRYQDKSQVKMDLLTINDIPQSFKAEIEADGNQHFVVSDRNKNPISYISKVKKIAKDNKYNIVYVHGNSATMAVDLLGAKLGGVKARVAHSHNTRCNHQLINKILMPIFSRLYTDCCACSIEAGRFLFKNKECYIVNNGICISKYSFDEVKRNEIRKKYNITQKIVLGHIGRFTYQKNQEFLISILKGMVDYSKDAVLLLVGIGELMDSVKQKAKEAGMENRVIFYGTTDYVNEVIQAMDCFVFPSRFEGLGIAAIEAQAAGLNCVASDQVPAKMKVNPKTVFLPLNINIKKWVEAVDECVSTVDERKRERENVSESLRNAGYDIEENCRAMLNFYQRILERK